MRGGGAKGQAPGGEGGTLRARPRPLRPRPSRVSARAPSSALAAEPPLPPDEWSRLLPGRDPAPPGAPAPSGEGAGPGEGGGSRRCRGAGRRAGVAAPPLGGHGLGRTARAPRARLQGTWAGGRPGRGPEREVPWAGGREGGRLAGDRDACGAARAEDTDQGGGARSPAAGQRGREARAFCPGFSGGAPAAVSSARVFVFRWRGPGTAGGRGSGGGGSRSGMSLATAAGHPPPRATLAPCRAGPHDELQGAGLHVAPLAAGEEKQAWGPRVAKAPLRSPPPPRAGCGWVWARGARGITQRWAALLGFFHLPAAEAGEGPVRASGPLWSQPPTFEPGCPVLEYPNTAPPSFPS